MTDEGRRISSASELIKLLKEHSEDKSCVSDVELDEFTSKEENLRPILKFFQKLDRLQDDLSERISDFFKNNLLTLLILEKNSGKVAYNYMRDEMINPDLVGGFLTAIQGFGSELISKDSPIKELCYKDFLIRVEEGKYTNVVVVLLDNPNVLLNRSVSEKMRDFIISFELIHRGHLKDWDGRIDVFDDAESLLKEFFFKSDD